MEQFEYQITAHTAESFQKVAYFCTKEGACSLNDVPGDQVNMLMSMLNEQGQQGWELVQLAFGKEGFLAFWKRLAKE